MKKTMSIATVLALIGLASGGFAAAYKLDDRYDKRKDAEYRDLQSERRDTEIIKLIDTMRSEVNHRFDRIERKMDRSDRRNR